MKAVIGLGNPGLRYKFTRHNLGFLVVTHLAKAKKIQIKQRAFNCLLGKGVIKNQQVLLGLPLTLMNLSGEAVAEIVKREKIKLIDLLVVCDDVNLPLGKIRLRPKGSPGGHKGLGSIIANLGSEDFPRLRIGLGQAEIKAEVSKPHSLGRGNAGLSEYVLGNFNKRETRIVNVAIEEAAAAALVWIKEGITVAMNRFNRKGD